MSVVRVACVQLRAREAVDDSVEVAGRLVAEAAARGAQLVVLPEKWPRFGAPERLWPIAEPVNGPLAETLAGWAREHGVALVAGSISERVPGDDTRLRNTSLAFDAEGRLAGAYRKLHLFDVDVEGRRIRESDGEAPGEHGVLCELAGLKVGLSVCYDLRFGELYRAYALAGAELVTVPAAFLERTGRDHWEVLLRARAIEQQLFVAAAAQHGQLAPGYTAYGRSLICDPWGVVLAQAGDGEGVITADCDLRVLERVRRELPALRHRRPEAYDLVSRPEARVS
jgi:deaminated glutathione amidase